MVILIKAYSEDFWNGQYEAKYNSTHLSGFPISMQSSSHITFL